MQLAGQLAGVFGRGTVAILTGPPGPVQRSASRPRSCSASTLRSSPVPEGRCNSSSSTRPASRFRCDPHRPRRAGATVPGVLAPAEPPRCDPHRPRRAGATGFRGQRSWPVLVLRSSPAPEGRCNAQRPHRMDASDVQVAILTGPGGPVQPPCTTTDRRAARRCDPHRPWRAGATPRPRHHRPVRRRLRSSPALEGRCNGSSVAIARRGVGLRSSPALEGRCNLGGGVEFVGGFVAILTGPGGPVQPDAYWVGNSGNDFTLRSSPALEGRCNQEEVAVTQPLNAEVAILTGPGGPVQPDARARIHAQPGVAILTGPGGPVQPVRSARSW